MKYSVITFGCRVNQADSLAFEERFRRDGAEPAPPDSADVVVVNTCSVTATADQGARQTIRRIARVNPSARIVVTGCYATRDADAVEQLPGVVRVVCNDDKPRLVPLLRQSSASSGSGDEWPRSSATHWEQSTADRFGDGDGACGLGIEPGVAGRTAYTLRVQTGCAEPCSYCIIPETRGVPRTVQLADVLAEVSRVCAAGFREIALTGVHLGSYGRDRAGEADLLGLLIALRDAVEPKGRESGVLFRISSLEPMDCSPAIVTLVRDSSCFAPHFHLPLQHASPRVLRAMRRPYDLDYYSRLVDRIRREIPHASIGSDVIVGFPGETVEDFEELSAYLEESPLTHVHVFPYSDRPGTPASLMKSRPAGVVVKERGARLRQTGARLTRRFLESQVGTVHRALTLEDGTLAVTANYLKVRIPPGRARNEWVRVRVVAHSPVITGEVVR